MISKRYEGEMNVQREVAEKVGKNGKKKNVNTNTRRKIKTWGERDKSRE